MHTIHKYKLSLEATQTVSIRDGFTPLHVGADPQGELCLWCRVNPEHPPALVSIAVVGTGQEIPNGYIYLGSATCGSFVWHVFIREEDLP